MTKTAAANKAKPTAQPTAPAPAQPTNRMLHFRKNHPGNRCSYGVAGVPGIVVVT
jgi:hypothetical protein